MFFFCSDFFLTLLLKNYSIFDIISKALSHNSISDYFCLIMVIAVIVYFVCVIIDTIDVVIIYKEEGSLISFLSEFWDRIFYNMTYIFNLYHYKLYCILFKIQIIICVIGLVFIL